MNELHLVGSHGEFTIDADTGLPVEPLPDGYSAATRFDVAEYKQWVRSNYLGDADTADILVLGYWYSRDCVELYQPAEASFRAEVIEELTERRIARCTVA